MFGLNRRYTIRGKKIQRTEGGSATEDVYDIAVHVPGTIQNLAAQEKVARFGAANVNVGRLWMEYVRPLATNEWIVDEDSNEEWRLSDTADAAGRGHHWEALVEKVK